jgi:Mg2+-importing ATPase
LDDAILEHGEIDASGWRKIDEVPFDFERRRVSVLLDNGTTRHLVVKGAPEDILRLSTQFEGESETDVRPLDTASLATARKQFDDLGNDGFRVLAIARRQVKADCSHAVVGDETELVFAGFAAFLDPPKESAKAALAGLAADRVEVKVITGDNELVSQHIFSQLGIPVTGVLTGAEIRQMDDPALAARAEQVNLFCRVTPVQKNRIILALKQRGHVVGYLGDGINDAPSLHSADVGISVDSAVDVAKEAADMILMEQDLAVFHAGEALFHTGWFIESMATQVLVIFIIRTRKNPFKSRPNPWLVACSLSVVAAAVLLPFTPAGVYLGFTAPPVFFFLILAAMLLVYLFAVELMKRWFFRRFAAE